MASFELAATQPDYHPANGEEMSELTEFLQHQFASVYAHETKFSPEYFMGAVVARKTRELITRQMECSDNCINLATLGGRIIGASGLLTRSGTTEAGLNLSYVDAEFRGANIGTNLMTMTEAHAKSIGVNKLHLRVLSNSEKSEAFYRRHGFTELIDEISLVVDTPPYFGDTAPQILYLKMHKQLEGSRKLTRLPEAKRPETFSADRRAQIEILRAEDVRPYKT